MYDIDRCPHAQCGVATPNLVSVASVEMQDGSGGTTAVLKCTTCGHVVLVELSRLYSVQQIWPPTHSYSTDIPVRARKSLHDARGTLGHPSPSIMCSAQAIDWMLKAKGLANGSLFGRIEEAAKAHLITEDMKLWAHEVRLGANAERHSDPNEEEPTAEEAIRLLSFAEALAEILFELPERVKRGRGKPPGQASDPAAPPPDDILAGEFKQN